MTAQASLHAATPANANANFARTPPRRTGLARWAAVLTLLTALLGAGVCMTATLPDVCPVVALVH